MTVTATPDRPEYDVTLEEHRVCNELVSSLEDRLDHEAERTEEFVARVLEDLHGLLRVLPPHFAREEAGVFEEICMDHPRFSNRVDRLRDEHAGLKQSLEETISLGESLTDPERWQFRQFSAKVQLFVATLRRHSSEEDEMIRSAFWDDEGTVD